MDDISILETQAIDAAIANDWPAAIDLNNKILQQDNANIEALLRLGFAYMQVGDNENASKTYKIAIKIQPKNQIALDNLEKIEILEKQYSGQRKPDRKNFDPNLFLDVPGKTKTVQLTNLGQKQHLADLHIGQEVELKNKKRRLEIRTSEGNYIGTLPDDISKRLSFFLENQSVYQVFIKEASLSRILVFIREAAKGEAVKGYVSFPNTTQPLYHPLHGAGEGMEDGESDSTDDADLDDVWDDEAALDHEEDHEKTDLLHIQTPRDDDESDE